jgi:hypothetical protein
MQEFCSNRDGFNLLAISLSYAEIASANALIRASTKTIFSTVRILLGSQPHLALANGSSRNHCDALGDWSKDRKRWRKVQSIDCSVGAVPTAHRAIGTEATLNSPVPKTEREGLLAG